MIDSYIQQIIEEILTKMNVPYESISRKESDLPGYTKFSIESNDSSLLIGKEGATLTALSYIVRKMVESYIQEHSPEYRFFIDVGDYEVSRIRKVQDIAKTFAVRAQTFKRDVEMEPMSPYDRMIVHATLADYGDVSTSSDGEGQFRKVIVKYTG